MPEPINKQLYKEIKRLADKKFSSKTGVYKSSWIVREYKKRGGLYKGPRPTAYNGLKRWYKEHWVNIRNKIPGDHPCGRDEINSKNIRQNYPVCRPTVRVSSKTPKTISELSQKTIKRAIKEKSKNPSKVVSFGGGKRQYRGRLSKVMVPVPSNVKKWAKKAFELRRIGFKGATKTGWQRAKQLSERKQIPIEDLRFMRNWYARHIITSYPSFRVWQMFGMPKTEDWHERRGIISWVTWGADAGLKWVNSPKVIKLLNKHFNKSYTNFIKKDF